MTREWKPGDMADVTSAGNVRAFRTDKGWTYVDGSTQGLDADHYAFRPLVVIDPDDREQVAALLNAWERAEFSGTLPEQPMTRMELRLRTALREFANPTPPRIDEPGTWGVVEASCVHSDERRKWVRHEDDNWWPAEKYSHAEVMVQKGRDPRLPDGWDDLVDPVLVREGVAS